MRSDSHVRVARMNRIVVSAVLCAVALAGFSSAAYGEEVTSELTSYEQPMTRPNTPSTPRPSTEPRPTRQRARVSPFSQYFGENSRRGRLFRSPDMFGDFFSGPSVTASVSASLIAADLPLAGGTRWVKIADSNRALPTDRVYLLFNHFHSGMRFERFPSGGGPALESQSFDVNRYTIGAEKTLGCGDWSLEFRMPFTEEFEFASPSGAPDFILAGGDIGDLAVVLKKLVYEDEDSAIALGIGVNTPTGSDATGALPTLGTSFRVHNDAVHLLPFLGISAAPTDRLFYHAFAQIDVVTHGNRIDVDGGIAGSESGRLNDPTLLQLSATTGYWLLDDEYGWGQLAVAALAEIHYTSTLQDPDVYAAVGGTPTFSSAAGQFDIVNLTGGLHLQQNANALRVATVVPLTTDERYFDAEIQVAFIRRF